MSSILSLEDQARRALANAINAELLPSYQKMVRKQLNIHDYVFQCQYVKVFVLFMSGKRKRSNKNK